MGNRAIGEITLESHYKGIRNLSVVLILFGSIVFIIRAVSMGLSIDQHIIRCMPILGCKDINIGYFFAMLVILLPSLLIIGGLGIQQRKQWGWWSLAIYSSFTIFYELADSLSSLMRGRSMPSNEVLIYSFICLILLIYLFQEKVLMYFSMDKKKGSKILILLFSSIIILLLFELSIWIKLSV